MSAALNSEAGGHVGMQSTPDRQTPVSGQEQGCVRRGVSSRTRKQTMTTSLTGGQRGMAQPPKKAKTRKSRGVKSSKPLDQEGLSPARYRMLAEEERPPVSSPLLHPNRKVFNFRLTRLSLRTQTKRVMGAYNHKSDQFALSPMTPPQGLPTPGGITTRVTDNPVLAQDPSPVLDSARSNRSTRSTPVISRRGQLLILSR